MSSKVMLTASLLTHTRPITCAAAAAASACLHGGRLVHHPPDLINWVRGQGGFVHKSIKIAHFGEEKRDGLSFGLGLVVCEDIPKGADLIALPYHVPLRFEDKDGILMNLARHIPEELWAMKLGLKLLHERAKKGSLWWPYISNLPETYTVPIFFPSEDIKNLQYAPLLHQVNMRCRFLLDFENLVKKELENVKLDGHPFVAGQDIDASSLGWAMSAVSSRAFRLHGSKHPEGCHTDVPMLLPLVDMCNHSFTPNAEILQEKESSVKNMLVKVIAGTQIKQDDPLLLNYGCLNNDLFLLDYGFVIPSNPYDCIELKYDPALLDAASVAAGISSPNFSSPFPWQQHILFQLNLDGENSNLKVRIGGSELVEDRLLAALRVLLSNEKEAVERQDLCALKSMSTKAPLGLETEIAVFRTTIALCVIALGHFPTKIMEDESTLKHKVSVTTELAVRYRVQKKSVIIDAIRDLTKRVRLLSSKESMAAQ